MEMKLGKGILGIGGLLVAAVVLYLGKDRFFGGGAPKNVLIEENRDIDLLPSLNTVPSQIKSTISSELTACLTAAENDPRAQPNCIAHANRAIVRAMATNSQYNYQSNNKKYSSSHRWPKPKPLPRARRGCIHVGSIHICPGCIRVGSIVVGCRGEPSRRSSRWYKYPYHRRNHYWSGDRWWDERRRSWRRRDERDDDDHDHRGGYRPRPSYDRSRNDYEKWQRRASDTEVARQYGLTPYKDDWGIKYMRGLRAKVLYR